MDQESIELAWLPFEKIEGLNITWKRAKRAIAATTSTNEFVTIDGWDAKARWIYGSHHNEKRIYRLCSTTPHGFDPNGDPWYSAALYPAPPDPIYELYNLVGLVTWVRHVGCLWPSNYGPLMLPLVRALERRSQHFIVPVFFGSNDDRLDQPIVMLPRYEEIHRLLDRLGC